jgi:hypothetical protein
MIRRFALPLLALALPAAAGDFPSLSLLSQEQFRRLAEDVGAAASYKGVTPATALGLAGFDVGVEVSATDVKNADLFRLAGNSAPDYLYVPKVHLYKGLPFGFDLGAFVGAMNNLNATVYGIDGRYAFMQDTVTTPAVALRLSGTRTTDVGRFRLQTMAADLMVSKRLTLVTPYAGAGLVRTQAKAGGAGGLADETFNRGRYFGGFNMNFAVINLAVEAEKLGGNTTLSAKAGWRF